MPARLAPPPAPRPALALALARPRPAGPHLLLGALSATAFLLEILLIRALHTLPQALGGTSRLLAAAARGPRAHREAS